MLKPEQKNPSLVVEPVLGKDYMILGGKILPNSANIKTVQSSQSPEGLRGLKD